MLMVKAKRILIKFTFVMFFWGAFQILSASHFVEMKAIDKDYLLLYFKDGDVEFVDDGLGNGAYGGTHAESSNSKRVLYGRRPDLTQVTEIAGWIIKSSDDHRYGNSGINPGACYRKSRVNGMSQGGWGNNDWIYDYSFDHYIILKLPYSMEQSKNYTVIINEAMNTDSTAQSITYDIFNCPSEAIHTNLIGFLPHSRLKAVDLYYFMGDGGRRDYTEFQGNAVYIYDVNTKTSQKTGTVSFWMKAKKETHWNLTGSDVWTADLMEFTTPGTYRIAIEDVGCSETFEIRDDIFKDPFQVSLLGYFYMRIGQDNMDMTPVPRRPLWIQDQDPPNCKIQITDMNPYHPEWNTFTSGSRWDTAKDWAPYVKTGSPTNPRAIGGHSDALDWDRHLAHVSNIYDMLLAYILTDGALSDDDCRIAESGNGIPDILDEARNEVDFWLNLRFGKGYSHGLTNPSKENIIYQSDNTPIAAWANALNSAMLAYAFQIAGLNEFRKTYLDSAEIAYTYANELPDPMLDTRQDLGQSSARGRDFKMMAAAYLYNLTGDTKYEDVVKKESVATGFDSEVFSQGKHNQLWGSAAYILTRRDVHYPKLQQNMKSSIIYHAKKKEADYVNSRPSRRGYFNDGSTAWFQTVQDMPRTLIAHAITDDPADKAKFLDALVLEADWGLGRNPINTIQMTTATTALASKRSIENCYTSGRDDGTPGLHPGHTPYLNAESWGGEMAGNNPKKVFEKFYPAINNWPHASKYINSRYLWAHSEFTPRQTMRFKTLLYGYLYGIFKKTTSIRDDAFDDSMPQGFDLLNNYPNPFNCITQIRYNLPQPTHVTINIYNIQGALVATLLHRDMSAGCHEISYDARDLASGVYFYCLETKDFSEVRKMLMLK